MLFVALNKAERKDSHDRCPALLYQVVQSAKRHHLLFQLNAKWIARQPSRFIFVETWPDPSGPNRHQINSSVFHAAPLMARRGPEPPPFPGRPGRRSQVQLSPPPAPHVELVEPLPPLRRWIPPPGLDLDERSLRPQLRPGPRPFGAFPAPVSPQGEKESKRMASVPIFRNVPNFDRPRARPPPMDESVRSSCHGRVEVARKGSQQRSMKDVADTSSFLSIPSDVETSRGGEKVAPWSSAAAGAAAAGAAAAAAHHDFAEDLWRRLVDRIPAEPPCSIVDDASASPSPISQDLGDGSCGHTMSFFRDGQPSSKENDVDSQQAVGAAALSTQSAGPSEPAPSTRRQLFVEGNDVRVSESQDEK
eukprot:s167_g7.t1